MKKIYLNNGQLETHLIAANSETLICSRRFGKSDGIIAPRLKRNILAMPRSAGGILGATYQQLLTRTLPATLYSLERQGIKNEIHYYVGRKAPAKAGFKMPYIIPHSWDHIIHWFNGSISHLISQDVRFSSNSLTLDYLIGDEARSFNYDKLKNETIPAVSGMFNVFDNCPWHKGIILTSDMPQSKKADWLTNRKDLMDSDLIEAIKGVILQINSAKDRKSIYAKRLINRYTKELVEFRRLAHLYREFDAIDNLEILGESYIRQMKRELPPLIFMTSILNKRIKKISNGFYPSFDESIHTYDAFNNSYLNNIRTESGSINLRKINKQLDCKQDNDIDLHKPLCIAFDYNANINWVVIGQPGKSDNSLFILKSMYVKDNRKLRELCRDFSNYYRHHQSRDVIYYYNQTAKQGRDAIKSETYIEIVCNELSGLKWNVKPVYIGQTMKHHLKHQYIDDAFKGVKYLFPLFNKNNNFDLIQAIEMTGIKVGRNGFEKDKSGEKLPETENDPLELRTDGTDAFDDLFIGCSLFPQISGNINSVASYFGK